MVNFKLHIKVKGLLVIYPKIILFWEWQATQWHLLLQYFILNILQSMTLQPLTPGLVSMELTEMDFNCKVRCRNVKFTDVLIKVANFASNHVLW